MKTMLSIRRCLLAASVLATWASAAPAQTTGGPYQFYTVTPCRLVDSRSNFGATLFSSGVAQNVTVKGRCGIPTTAKVAAINLTIVGPSADGFLSVWPAGSAYPGTSTINARAGEVALANGAIVGLAATVPDLSVAFGTANGGTTNIVIDITGYFQ